MKSLFEQITSGMGINLDEEGNQETLDE